MDTHDRAREAQKAIRLAASRFEEAAKQSRKYASEFVDVRPALNAECYDEWAKDIRKSLSLLTELATTPTTDQPQPAGVAIPEGMVEVVQADREATAEGVRIRFGHGELWCSRVRDGTHDEDPIVQAFARHRLAHTPKAQSDV